MFQVGITSVGAAQPLAHPRVGVFHILVCSRIIYTWFSSLIKDKSNFAMTKSYKNLIRKQYPPLKRCQILEATCPTLSLTPISLLSWSLSLFPCHGFHPSPALLAILLGGKGSLSPKVILWPQEDPQLLWDLHSLLQNQ